MKAKGILISAICVFVAAVIAIVIMCCLLPSAPAGTNTGEETGTETGDGEEDKLQSYAQSLSYAESTEKIDNPDQGFYRPVYVRLTEEGASYNKNIVNAATQLYHLRVDISAFSGAVNGAGDKPLSDAALEGLEELLTYLKENEKNAVVRFAYDPSYNGSSNKEPAKAVILSHIGQVCPVLNGFENTVTAIEAG